MGAMIGNSGWGRVVAAGAVAVMLASSGAAAQQRERAPRPAEAPSACRCVDADGNALDHCVCFLTPDMPEAPRIAMAMAGRRAVLGVNVKQDQPAQDNDQGVRLFGVEPDGPAGKAGLEEGDVLVRVAGQSLTAPLADARAEDRLDDDGSRPVQRLLAVLAEREPGDRVEIEYLRGSARHTTTIAMDEPRAFVRFAPEAMAGFGPSGFFGPTPETPMAAQAWSIAMSDACPSEAAASSGRRVIMADLGRSCVSGVELLEMNAGLAEYFGAAEGGVLVADAGADNPLGLRAGDVLVSVDGRAARGVDQALRVLRSYESGEDVDLQVRRKDQSVAVKGRIR